MEIHGWRYYNHAAMPSTPPHREADLTPIRDGSIWKMDGSPLLARWTTDWDCGHETNWWYVIKDTPFDIESLKAKRRYEINKGLRSFEVKRIPDPAVYAKTLSEIVVSAYEEYPAAYRPKIDKDLFAESVEKYWQGADVFGAFSVQSGNLVGYALLFSFDTYSDFAMMKVIPSYEKQGVNAALVYGILDDYRERLAKGFYICDGARNISHETAFQDYLEKYFGFRKAYCNLNLAYAPKWGWIVKCLFPFRNALKKLDGISLFHKINSILKMEEFARNTYE